MNSALPKFLRKFLAYGSSQMMDEWEIRRILLLNAFYLLASAVFIAGTIETYVIEGVENGNWSLLLTLSFQIGLIPLLMKKANWAEFYFLLMGNITLFIFNNLYGPEGGTYMYYFPFMLTIAFLVDFKKPLLAFIHVLISIVGIVAGVILKHQFLYHVFSSDILTASFNFSFFISSFSMAAITLILVKLSYNQYHHFLARISERNAAEELMKNSIREKETLLAEVHHRVKNNLAVITSLLNLQMNVVTNEYTRNVLRESRNRVSSMALIHQKLYQNSNVEQIDFGSYAAELVDEIKRSYPDNTAENIHVSLEAEHIPLSLTKAVPAGLLLNELLSNCYKHAFHGKSDGKIFIRFRKTNAHCELEVEDNGVGLSGDFKIEKQETLGMTIIQSLAEQIDSKIIMSGDSGSGTKVKIQFTA